MLSSKIRGDKLWAGHWLAKVAFIASLCLVVLGAACGGGGDTSARTPTGPTATVPIKVRIFETRTIPTLEPTTRPSTPTPTPTTSASTSIVTIGPTPIVFLSDRDIVQLGHTGRRFQMWVMEPDGSNQTRLTFNELSDAKPHFSPDGTKIAFHRGKSRFGVGLFTRRNILLMNPDGSGQTEITNDPEFDDFHPSWSPDGSKIVFYSGRDGDDEIYVMDADGSNPIRLTDSPGSDRDPEWSPNGDKIVFVSLREGGFDVYVMDADGSNQTQLTSTFGENFDPGWSPDGSKIVFVSSREGLDDEIYVMDADGSNQTRLTERRGPDQGPAWSPDGSKIAYQSLIELDAFDNFEIFVMDPDGSNSINITNNLGQDTDPVWSPLP